MLYLIFFNKIIKKKSIFELKILELFIVCSLYCQMLQFQVLKPRFQASRLSTKFQFTEPTLFYSYGVSGISFKPSSPMRNLIKPVLVVKSLDCKGYKRPTVRLKDWGNKMPMATKKWMRFFTIKAYCLYPKLFKRKWLAVNTKIFWLAILAFTKQVSCWPKKIIGQPSTITLRST